MENLNLILPEIFISLSIMFLLVLGVFKKDSSKLTFNISLLILLIASIITLNETFSINHVTLFNNSVVIDPMSSLMKIITLIGAFLVLVISSAYLKSFKIFKIEYPVLILSSVLGMMVMISSNDLMVFYMGLELQSLALYVLATFNRDQLKSSEAGLKYFVLSALSSGLLLYGCSLIYGFSGSTNFNVISSQLNSNEYVLTFGIVFILVGLAFKSSAVPFHMWAPDVYEGSPTSVTLFFTMVPKIAALTVFIRFLYVPFLNLIDQWQMIIIFLSIASMLFGAIAAANSLSDIYSMGAIPKTALNIICFPTDDLDPALMNQIFKGASDKLKEAETALVGGHSIKDDEPKYGLSVTGLCDPAKIWRNNTGKAGDAIILTKAIGSGVLFNQNRKAHLSPELFAPLIENCVRLNRYAKEAIEEFKPNAVTDVTGFGLLGHLREMLGRHNISLLFENLRFLPGALDAYKSGMTTGSNESNKAICKDSVRLPKNLSREEKEMLYDTQTSGGLLISIDPSVAEEALAKIIENGDKGARIIGFVEEAESTIPHINVII